MKRSCLIWSVCLVTVLWAAAGWSAYHHEGEQDADKFLAAHPEKAGTKLDHCALCYSGASTPAAGGIW